MNGYQIRHENGCIFAIGFNGYEVEYENGCIFVTNINGERIEEYFPESEEMAKSIFDELVKEYLDRSY